jgi:predicted 2-oxoglutarate/Fe(II)-dependent dioxygenase YbiX
MNTEQTAESPWKIKPGHFGDSSSNIVVIKNFVELEDLKLIQEFCPTINEWNNSAESVYAEDGTCLYNADYWNDRQCSSEILEKLNRQVWLIVDKYIDKMQKTIEDFYKVKVSKRPPVIMKWRPGIEQKPHADKQLNDGRPHAFVDDDLNSLLYYNEDFEGGDLFYPQHDITVRPKPGLAVMHPGDVNYLHGVTMITKGFRYTTPSFYTVL